MRIACLGWGSLIWKPGNLLIEEKWHSDGPFLPIEFSRQSDDGRLTLVITPSADPIQTLWVLMTTNNLMIAKESLRVREGIGINSAINFVGERLRDDTEMSHPVKSVLSEWINEKKLDAVIWTNLPPKYNGVNGIAPTLNEALLHLRSLEGMRMETAREYIRRAPAQIKTHYRRAIEQQFGWTPL